MPDSPPHQSPEHWRRVASLFHRMQDADDPVALANRESDHEVSTAALRLWQNLNRAKSAGFLDKPIELLRPKITEILPQFSAGQTLAGRFEIKSLLGTGGMGEVYTAFDHGVKEVVAVKTIRANLATQPTLRNAFLAEIQSARRVTHPHVCRINDLFEESGLPFLSMEYLEGERLSTILETQSLSRRDARTIAIQLAEGLDAAHRAGILHCDFKPSNVILTGTPGSYRAVTTDFGLARALQSPSAPREVVAHSLRAGTIEYMAPELISGESNTIRTDIYAYGCVLGHLMPSNRIAAHCLARRPEDRPASLQPVIRSLRGDLSRRIFIGAAIATAAAGVTFELVPRARLPLANRTRIVLNGFHAPEPALASDFRELLITALRQSTLLSIIGDGQLRRQLKSLIGKDTLPADRTALVSAVGSALEVALVIEGALTNAASRLQISLDVFTTSSDKPALTIREQVSNPKNLVGLADQAALHLRREFGESAATLQIGAGYTPLEQVTSDSPEAIECYFKAMRLHTSAERISALTWFDEAVRLDPNFALAWLERGVSLMAYRLADSLDSFQHAFDLRSRVTQRERLWIETRYLNVTGDWDSALQSCLKLIALFPDEADFQRETAFQMSRLGRPREALPYNQRAVELDSTNINNTSEWIVNRATANLNDEALELYRQNRDHGEANLILNWGAGLAYMGKGETERALQTFEDMEVRPDLDHWARRLQCEPLILAGRFHEAMSVLAADIAWDVSNGEQNELDHRRVWLGTLEWISGSASRARPHLEALAELPPMPTSLSALRAAGLLALFLKNSELATKILGTLKVIERHWPSSHTTGARSALEGALLPAAESDRATSLFDVARGLRPDALTFYPIALWQMENRNFAAASELLNNLKNESGRIYRLYFPGLLSLARIHRARCLTRMAKFADALRLYEQVTTEWQSAGKIGLCAEIYSELFELRKLTEK